MKSSARARVLLLLAAVGIGLLFVVSSYLTYNKFHQYFIEEKQQSLKSASRIIGHNLELYFDKLIFTLENISLNENFLNNDEENNLRYHQVSHQEAMEIVQKQKILKIIDSKNSRLALDPGDLNLKSQPFFFYWQVYKGIPELIGPRKIVSQRRKLIRNVLIANPNIHNFFIQDKDANLVLLEPFEVQKNLTSYNYSFRDYFQIAKKNKKMGISEGYISHDKERSQLITLTNPVFINGEFNGIIALSISAKIFQKNFFLGIKNALPNSDGSTFYIIDRHGHVMASSSGKHIYFPDPNAKTDEADLGNVQNLGIFKKINWKDDYLEKGNIWERKSKTWDEASLQQDYFEQYVNLDNELVFGSFHPLRTKNAEGLIWGILVETPQKIIKQAEANLIRLFCLAGVLLLVVLILLCWLILRNFNSLYALLISKEKEIGKVSSQVAHDIRSPLAALNVVVNTLETLPEDLRLILRTSIKRIQDIANHLIETQKQILEKIQPSDSIKKQQILIASLIESIVTEKRIQYRDRIDVTLMEDLYSLGYGLFATLEPSLLKQVISNLINNSFEAIRGKGVIEVKLWKENEKIFISIADTGVGISPEIQSKIFEKGFSANKKHGSGLGLYFAKIDIEKMGGTIKLNTRENYRTCFVIELFQCEPPAWYIPQISISTNQMIVVVDDDDSIHQIWESRFQPFKSQIRNQELKHFSGMASFESWLRDLDQSLKGSCLFLVDFEFLGSGKNGIDLIVENKIQSQSILVTSRYEEDQVLIPLNQNNISMIPKSVAAYVPIGKLMNETPKF